MIPTPILIAPPSEAPFIIHVSAEQWRFLETICHASSAGRAIALELSEATELMNIGFPIERVALGLWRVSEGARIARVFALGGSQEKPPREQPQRDRLPGNKRGAFA